MGRGQGDHVGTGEPISFICPVARRNRIGLWGSPGGARLPEGHDRIERTGRTKHYPRKGQGLRTMNEAHEYKCECGHVGWSAHRDILHYPIGT